MAMGGEEDEFFAVVAWLAVATAAEQGLGHRHCRI